MANLDSLKDPRSIASISALVAVGVSWTYFHNEISKLKEEQAETSKQLQDIKKHLSTLLLSSPDSGKQLEQVIRAVKMLDDRLDETQEKMRYVQPPEAAPVKKSYQRMTERSMPSRPEVRRAPKVEFDLEDDIAAMTA